MHTMTQQVASSSANFYKAMRYEQFKQVVEAIAAGKYSWACVLLLWFSGYNPLRYIPYRTYNRLVKENRKEDTDNTTTPNEIYPQRDGINAQPMIGNSLSKSTQIKDLAFVETMDKKEVSLRGGNLRSFWKSIKFPEKNPIKFLWVK
jgi:hypothetical protein